MESTARTNTQVVQACFGFFSQGNIPALLNELTDDVKWTVPGPANILPWVGTRKGKAEVGEFFRLVDENNEFLRFEPREFISEGDKVITLGFLEAKAKTTGRISSSDWAMAFYLRNGKIYEHKQYSDTHDAVEAFRK